MRTGKSAQRSEAPKGGSNRGRRSGHRPCGDGAGQATVLGFDRWGVEASMLFGSIARAVSENCGREVIAVEVVPGKVERGGVSLAEWERKMKGVNGSFCFEEAAERFSGWRRLRLYGDPERMAGALGGGLLRHLGRHFGRVLLGVGCGEGGGGFEAVLEETGRGFLYFDGRDGQFVKRLAGMRRELKAKVRPVMWRRRGERVVGIRKAAAQAGFRQSDFCRWRGRYGDDLSGHIRSVAREISGCRVGLALSSGSAKGLAHIGVIQVLEENGIEVDVVAGTSMGAYVGACWCVGHDGAGLQRLAEDIRGPRGVWKLVDPVFPPRKGFIRGRRVRRRLERSIAGARFEELLREFHVVATDWETLERRVFHSGDVSDAVHASLAMPGVCEPVEIDRRLYLDGAACEPLPVGVLEDLGVERIIAVNVMPSVDDLAARAMEEGGGEVAGWKARLGGVANRNLNYFARGNLLDNLMRGLQAGQMRMAEAAAARADVSLRAYPSGARWFGFDCHAEYIEAGRAAAESSLYQLKALVGGTGRGSKTTGEGGRG